MLKSLTIIPLILLAGLQTPLAQNSYKVLDWQAELAWHKQLIQKMHEQFDAREQEIQEDLASETALERYRRTIRKKYAGILGSFPPASELNAQVTGTIQQDGYRIEKVIYESFPGHHVTSNLYIPSGEGPFPGILFFCGHERTAKATPSYQKMAALLAKHGLVVLVIDPISQGERFQLTDAAGKPLTRGGTTEHTLLNAGSNLVGTNVMNYEFWDNKRGLDYLLTRPEVDEERIGVLGNSGGGTMTTYFLTLDERVDVAAVCSFVTRRRRSIETVGPQDGCQWIPFEGREHLEISDFLMMRYAPKPLLILAGQYDFFDYTGTKDAFEELKKVYTLLDQPQKVKLFTVQDGHGISEPKREAAVRWFRRWFYDDSTPVEEGALEVLDEEALYCTKTGQVNASFGDEYNIQERNLKLAQELEPARSAFLRNNRSRISGRLRSLLGFTVPDGIVRVEWKGETRAGVEIRFKKVILRRKGQVPLPGLILHPKERSSSRKTIVWFHEKGKQKVAENIRLMQSYLKAGQIVLLIDMRGMGETADPAEFNASKYYNQEYRNAQISLHIGKPVVGQRVQDVMTIIKFIKQSSRLPDKYIEIHATGSAATAVLHAAVFEDAIDQLILHDTIESYMEILENPTGKGWYSYVVPNALKYYDLPDLVALIGEEKVRYK